MRFMAVTCTAFCLFGCSTKQPPPPPGPTSGVDPGDDADPRALTDLDEAERQKLCDWTAARSVGGYDASIICESGLVVSSFIGQQACLDAFLGACSTVTVTDWEQCVDKVATDPCADYFFTATECLVVVQCLGLTDGGPAPPPDGGGE
jgi:hypothetical protein